eukprot:scaffold35204_cov56-Isochrysis_galbana.AAC.1
MANLAVNGHPSELGANPARLTNSHAAVPAPSTHLLPKEEGVIHGKPGGWRKVRGAAEATQAPASAAGNSPRGERGIGAVVH